MLENEGVEAQDKTGGVIEVTSRYEAMGIPFPDPKTMCLGQCEGTGVVPIPKDEMGEPWRSMWLEAEEEEPADDGWHFVVCPACKGTRLRQ